MSIAVGTVADDRIGRARAAAMPEPELVATYRAYVLGTQAVTLSPEMKAQLGGILDKGYVDNLCRLAVQAHADMLKLSRIEVDGPDGAAKDTLVDFIAQTWSLNQVPELSADVHFAAPRDGNYAVELSWVVPPGAEERDGRVRFATLDWWNGTRGVYVNYGPGGLADWAVYEWQELDPHTNTTTGRRVVYYPDRLERFERREGATAWEPYNLATDPVQGGKPVPWVDRTGAPIGIPIVHFPNLLIPNHQPGTSAREVSRRYGLSLLAGGPLGVQDAVNEAHYDLIAAARTTAFPMVYATGVGPTVDPATGKEVPLPVGPGAVLKNASENARYGILTPGDMSQLLVVLVDHHRTFARMTNTPMQIVAETDKDAASGVALLRMQLAAIRQARRAQTVYGFRWGSVFHKATMIANACGGLGLDTTMMLEGKYDPIEASDLSVMAEVAKNLTDAKLPLPFVLRALGMTAEQVDQIMAEKKAEAPPVPAIVPAANDQEDDGG